MAAVVRVAVFDNKNPYIQQSSITAFYQGYKSTFLAPTKQ